MWHWRRIARERDRGDRRERRKEAKNDASGEEDERVCVHGRQELLDILTRIRNWVFYLR